MGLHVSVSRISLIVSSSVDEFDSECLEWGRKCFSDEGISVIWWSFPCTMRGGGVFKAGLGWCVSGFDL